MTFSWTYSNKHTNNHRTSNSLQEHIFMWSINMLSIDESHAQIPIYKYDKNFLFMISGHLESLEFAWESSENYEEMFLL